MGIFKGFANLIKTSLGVEQLKKYPKDIKSASKIFFSPQKSQYKETFEQALSRLKLTEEDLNRRESDFNNLVRIFSLISLGLLIYLGYVIYQKSLIACLGTGGILLIVLAQLFRYHFWLFQIRQKRLGCTFKEWLRNLFSQKRA